MMNRIDWHHASAKAGQFARIAMAAVNIKQCEPMAILAAQKMLDHLWAMGFRPSDKR